MTDESTPTATPEELAKTIDEATWTWLRPHLERDAVILVAGSLELVDAGHALASDNAPLVSEWITAGKIGKPTATQVAAWDAHGESQQFLMLIVAPFILIQEIPLLVQ